MEIEISDEMREAVKNGAAWLDENYPGWETQINLQDLDMAECSSCIVGQAIGNYSRVVYDCEQASGDWEWSEKHGFEAPLVRIPDEDSDYDETFYRDYAGLETLWTAEVKDRFGN